VEACAIQQEENAFIGSSLAKRGKLTQRGSEGCTRDRRHQQPEGASAGGMDKAIDVGPLIAVMNQDVRTNAPQRPDSPDDGFEANAVFVHGPKLNPARR
jgi:hypothetical protein